MAIKFTVFRKLPAELRLKVWRSGFPTNGHFGIDYSPSTGSSESRDAWYGENTMASPVTLHVNQESRSETLKHYFAIQRLSVTGMEIKLFMSIRSIICAGSSM